MAQLKTFALNKRQAKAELKSFKRSWTAKGKGTSARRTTSFRSSTSASTFSP